MNLVQEFKQYLCDRIEASEKISTSSASVLVAKVEFCAKFPLGEGLEYLEELGRIPDEQWLAECGYVPAEQPSYFTRAVQKV